MAGLLTYRRRYQSAAWVASTFMAVVHDVVQSTFHGPSGQHHRPRAWSLRHLQQGGVRLRPPTRPRRQTKNDFSQLHPQNIRRRRQGRQVSLNSASWRVISSRRKQTVLDVRAIAADDPRSVVCVSVCLFVTTASLAKMTEAIKMPFEGRGRHAWYQRNLH